MRKLLILLVWIVTAAIQYSYADDTTFGGQGVAPIPITQTKVNMLAEKVIINGIDLTNNKSKGKWSFNCLYTFQNMTSHPLGFTMGFPFPVNNQYMGAISVPSGFKITLGSPLVYEFKVAIDGRPIRVQHTKISANIVKNLYYTDAYKWKVNFKPNQIVNITHHYITGITYDVMVHHWVRFVLRTGGLWQTGIIGRAQLSVIPNTPSRLCETIDKDNASIYKTTPTGMHIIGHGNKRKYVWDLHHFRPTKDLSLCFVTGQDFIQSTLVLPIILNTNNAAKKLSAASCSKLEMTKNTVYAQYGKIFGDSILQPYFNKKWWYQTNTKFSKSLLSSEDLKVISIISKTELNKKCF